ncbi:NepR family anti-sigma factor [Thalassorhabdomicrobium marinisediminis]|uniref:NepR family anti-sigma factor n=1 Tax=Thalassorhabdomicrobium marinisediminis TaxID=2170577 RepID=UPI00249187AC|nr:NepR family anti-sigma factor [Thalassorhabdomicrobium marinisediminis]
MNSKSANSKVQLEIERNLKRAYDEVIQQEVPDRFTSLLEQLKAAEAGETSSNGGSQNAN